MNPTPRPWFERRPTNTEIRTLIQHILNTTQDELENLDLTTLPPGRTHSPTMSVTTSAPTYEEWVNGDNTDPQPVTVDLRWKTVTCGRDNCELCASGHKHGPYLYAIIRQAGRRWDRSLGTRPTTATFYRRLTGLLTPEQIQHTIQLWKEEEHD